MSTSCVSSIIARGGVLESKQPRVDQPLQFLLGQMRRHRVFAGVLLRNPFSVISSDSMKSATRGGRSCTHDE